MRRSSVEFALLLVLMAGAGCDRKAAPDATPPPPAATNAATPARPPSPPPRSDGGPARDIALAMGPGTCEEDVPAIRKLPANGELGVDARYDRIAVHRDAYKACLVGMVRDATAVADPNDGPKRNPYAQGDLAYDLLARTGLIEYGECIAPEVMQRVASSGDQVVYEWLATPNHRRQLLRCLGKRLGG